MLQVRIAVRSDGRTEGVKINPSSAAFSRSRCENLSFPPFVRSFHSVSTHTAAGGSGLRHPNPNKLHRLNFSKFSLFGKIQHFILFTTVESQVLS